MKEYKTPVIEEVKEGDTIADIFESWGYCKAYVDRALAELSQYRLTGMTPGEIAEMRRNVSNMHGGWIPVEERLPEEDGTYLCTLDGELCGIEEPFTGMCGIEDGIWDEPDCVLAWRPLPNPYRPKVTKP